MHVPQFQPRQGVQIETDPKATSVGSAAALGDDEGVIDALIKRLQVHFAHFHAIAAPHAMLMKAVVFHMGFVEVLQSSDGVRLLLLLLSRLRHVQRVPALFILPP